MEAPKEPDDFLGRTLQREVVHGLANDGKHGIERQGRTPDDLLPYLLGALCCTIILIVYYVFLWSLDLIISN